MSKADMRFSRISWVGDLCQKFEAMCQEVDDIVSQEHIKDLENHVQSVGDNVMKFCSNVKDLLPSIGVPVKCETQSVYSVMRNIDFGDGDTECPSVANDKQLPHDADVIDSVRSYSSCIQAPDDLHSEDKLETPSYKERSSSLSGLHLGPSDSFHINQDYDSHSEEEKQSSSDASESICPDSSFVNQNFDSFSKEKEPPIDAAELIYLESSLISQSSDSSARKEEESPSGASELSFPDEVPCEMSTLSVFYKDNDIGDEVSLDVSSSAKHSSKSEFHQKEETVHDTVDGYSLESDFHCNEEKHDGIHKYSQGSEFHMKREMLCDSSNKFSLESETCVKEEMASKSIHKSNLGSEFGVKDEIVHDILSESCFDVSTDNAPYSLLASSVTSSESETSNIRLISSINSPLLEYSDHCETGFTCGEEHIFNNMVVENGSASTFSAAIQTSEASSSPMEKIEDVGSGSLPSSSSPALTEVPDVSHSDNDRLKLKDKELSVKVDLAGSCVFVEPEDSLTALSALPNAFTRTKKIRNSFSSGKKLEKEYKQLAIWYCDIDAEFDQVSGQKLAPSIHNKHLPGQDVQESEWELL